MSLRQYLILTYVTVTCLLSSLTASHYDYLEKSDVKGIMKQILQQHVEEDQVTLEIVKRSFEQYIEQVDFQKNLFIKSELDPFLEPSDRELVQFTKLYYSRNYKVYERLNERIQIAIKRAKAWRQEFYNESESVYAEASKSGALTKGLSSHEIEELSYSENVKELKERQRNDLIRFIAAQITRFDEELVMRNKKRVMDLYERNMHDREKEYLFVDAEGKALSSEKKEHAFILNLLRSLSSSLDAHTAFFNSDEAYDMRVRLEKGFQGIGVVLQEGIEGVVITRLIKGGPAENSQQVLADDRLVEIDGISIVDKPFSSVLDLIRGNEGSKITLGLKRKTDERLAFSRVTLTREQITVDEKRVDVSYDEVDGGIIGKITLYSFYEGENGISSENDMREAIAELHSKGRLKGLVFDLRQNTGGFLIQAVKVAGLFISNGVIVTSKYSDEMQRVFRDLDGYIYYNGPLVVLTSKMSASAAEIVAQTLQDYGSAIIVGDKHTYGKGSIQHQTVTNENSASFFKVTVGKYYTASGKTPQINGVIADIIVSGKYSADEIGEQFLDYPLPSDTIEPSYFDNLNDIQKEVRYWYVKYYLPTLQKKRELWTGMLPALRSNSQLRMSNNEKYQLFNQQHENEKILETAKEDEIITDDQIEELQMVEAVDIVKDMIDLRKKQRETASIH